MTTNTESLAKARNLIENAQASLVQAKALISEAMGQPSNLPYIDAKTASRVERLGEVAHRHLLFIEEHDNYMTRADSLTIRRELYGDKVRQTANQFGLKDSGALFYRVQPYGEPVRDDDEIRLTKEGLRIAKLWRAIHMP